MCFSIYIKIQAGCKNSGKIIYLHPHEPKIWLKLLCLAPFRDKCVFFSFYTEIQDGHQKWQETIFEKPGK